MTHVSVGVRRKRLVAPHYQHFGGHPFGIVVSISMRLRGVDHREIAERGYAPANAGNVAGKTRERERRDVRGLKRHLIEERQLPVDVAPRAVYTDDRVASIGGPDFANLGLYLVVSLFPRDALPLVLASCARAAHRILQAIRIVHRFIKREALDAQLTIRARIQGIALNTLDLTVLRVNEDAA